MSEQESDVDRIIPIEATAEELDVFMAALQPPDPIDAYAFVYRDGTTASRLTQEAAKAISHTAEGRSGHVIEPPERRARTR